MTTFPSPSACTLDRNSTLLSSPAPPLRLVMPRAKRERLAELAAILPRLGMCFALDCGRAGLRMLLVEAEEEATLCPVHNLVRRDGSTVVGQPVCVTAAW